MARLKLHVPHHHPDSLEYQLEHGIRVPCGPGVKRVGYRGFLSAVVMLWRMNRGALALCYKAKFEVIVPLRWFR